ncbi:MAG: hypothetical protein M3O70_23535 [Actinomycetota bacterium]|nr:hypothetical protein [Actinomycetota bacterium]
MVKRHRDLAVLLAAVTLAWNLYGFAGNFFAHYWPGWVTVASYLVNLFLLAGLSALVMGRGRGPSLLAVAGAVMAAWSLVGTLWEIGAAIELFDRPNAPPPLNLPQPPPLLGPLVPTLTGLFTARLAYRWRTTLR